MIFDFVLERRLIPKYVGITMMIISVIVYGWMLQKEVALGGVLTFLALVGFSNLLSMQSKLNISAISAIEFQ